MAFEDMHEPTMTCLLCGDPWGEGHDFPGNCPFYYKDGTSKNRNVSGRYPSFVGDKPLKKITHYQVVVMRRTDSKAEADQLAAQAAERGWVTKIRPEIEYRRDL